ncbi:MAG: tRNA guanosine(34) transglycosylase Tgt [Planctomycetes bacterium]|nr:tRNA guanosine(34) transglycosylase Tgt [Planctomycetota bacterium]
MSARVRFEVTARSGAARRGTLTVRGRSTPTPAFMPVATQGTLKGIAGGRLAPMGFHALLANTYHLALRPGEETVRALGGLHRFMDYDGILLTDSGGFQVFSLAERRLVDDAGVTFRSHLDGAPLRLTPERAMKIQHALDSDIAMVLDECPPADAPPDELRRAVERSVAWARRSLAAHRALDAASSTERACFAIVQGGRDVALRRSMADELARDAFDGFALGGIAVGEDAATIRAEAEQFAPLLPADKPRYLMGVGSPRELVAAVHAGIDLFDCVLPTRNARNGYLWSRAGIVKIRNADHAQSGAPIEEGCDCTACARHSRAYLRHLFQADEMLGPILATEHNLRFFQRLLVELRAEIESGVAADWSWLAPS